jgi:hypothetical protein
MRVAIIVVSILVVASTAYASDSCMTRDEAHRHFATSYLYWHGLGHCWDANPGRHPPVRNVQQKSNDVLRKGDHEPGWREAHSELPSSTAAPNALSSTPYKTDEAALVEPAVTPWSNRWVDVSQPASIQDVRPSDPLPVLRASARNSVPAVAASAIILVFLGSIVMVAVIEFIRRSPSV